MRISPTAFRSAVAALLTTLSACSETAPGTDQSTDDVVADASCGETCKQGYVCSAGACVPAACAGVSCPPGSACAGGRCYAASCPNAPCADDQVCIGNVCVWAACVGVSCPINQTCVDGSCIGGAAGQAPEAPDALVLVTAANASDPTPEVRVEGVVAGETVTLYTDPTCAPGSVIASGVATADTLVLTATPLSSDGSYTFYARSQNAQGATSACSTTHVTYTLDRVAPSPTGLSDDVTPRRSASWDWDCEEASCTYRASIDQNATGVPAGDFGTASALSTTAGGDGTYYLHVQARDPAGNTSAVVTVQVVLDNTAPAQPSALALVTPASSPSTNATPSIRVSGVAAGDTVGLHTDAACGSAPSATAVASGSSVVLTSNTLAEGTYAFRARVVDVAGNATCSTLSLSYQRDTSAPAVTGLTDDSTPTQSKTWTWGCSEAACTYRFLVDQNVNGVPSGAFSSATTTTRGAVDGTWYVHVQAQDAAGNTSATRTVFATLSNSAPNGASSLALISPATSPSTTTTPTIRVAGVAAGQTISLHTSATCVDALPLASAVASGTTIDLTTRALAEGSYTLRARTVDSVGASACSTVTLAYRVDLTAPTVTGLADATTPVTSKTWTWGCSESPCDYRFAVDQSASWTPAGAWVATTTATQGTGNGTWYVHVQVRDAAGNVSTRTVSAVLDNTAPTAPTGLSLQSPATSPGSDTTPTVTVSGVVSGDAVSLHTDSACSVGARVALATASATTINLTASVLPEASYTFYARTTDVAGNSACSTASVVYVVDTSAPTVTGLANDVGPRQSKTWTWSCTTTPCTYRFAVDTSATWTPTGTFAATATATQSTGTGTYYVHVQAQDAAGNASAVMTASVVLDNTPPSAPGPLTLLTPSTSPSNDTTPTIRVAGVSSGLSVTLHTDASCTGASQRATGAASATTIDLTTSALADASYVFYARAVDSTLR